MLDRLLAGMLNATITSLIALLAGTGLGLAYYGAIEFFMPHALAGTIDLAVASVLGMLAAGLIRHRSDLIDV